MRALRERATRTAEQYVGNIQEGRPHDETGFGTWSCLDTMSLFAGRVASAIGGR